MPPCLLFIQARSVHDNILLPILQEHSRAREKQTQKKAYLNITGKGIVEGVICLQANCPRRDGISLVFIFQKYQN